MRYREIVHRPYVVINDFKQHLNEFKFHQTIRIRICRICRIVFNLHHRKYLFIFKNIKLLKNIHCINDFLKCCNARRPDANLIFYFISFFIVLLSTLMLIYK